MTRFREVTRAIDEYEFNLAAKEALPIHLA